MKLTEIAAFGGLALGILNLIIMLYKEFWRKGKLKVELLRNEILYLEEGLYSFQIDLILTAKASDIQLRKIEIKHNDSFIGEYLTNAKNHQNLAYAFPLIQESVHKDYRSREELENVVGKYYQNKIKIQDYIIPKDKHTSFTFAGGLNTIQLMDGFQEVHLKNWEVKIYYLDKVLAIPFNFKHIGERAGNYID